MDSKIKEQWVAALRSGKYKQGRDKLRRGESYCCLGVLCELAVEAGVVERHPSNELDGISTYTYGTDGDFVLESNYLPRAVIEWAGLKNLNPSFGESRALSVLNDEGKPFSLIANVIEQNEEVI